MIKYVSEKVVAEITGRAVQSLRNDRHLGRGLPYYRCGRRSIRYRLEEVLEYMEAGRIETQDSTLNILEGDRDHERKTRKRSLS
jgi:hypothetical protein